MITERRAASADVLVARRGRLARAAPLVAILPPVIAQLSSTIVQMSEVSSGQGFGRRNLEASYHVLLTIRALREAPLSESLGLPIVTLGQQNDKWIGWGATVPNAYGDQVYTSFPPLGFWAPLVASLPLAHPGLLFLTLFNGALGLLTAVLTTVLAFRVARGRGTSSRAAGIGAAVAGTLYAISPEALQSQGVVYWPQSLSQPLLVALALLVFHRASGRSTRLNALLSGLLVAALCYTEWTGFVTAVLLAAVCIARPTWRRLMAPTAVSVLVGALLAGGVLLVQFASSVGIGPAFAAWTSRAGGRSAGSLPSLMFGWTLSAGATAVALAIAAAIVLARRPLPRLGQTELILAAALFAPVVENLLLQQHAAQFSFDRLKVVVPIAVATGVLVSQAGRRAVLAAAAACLLVAGVLGQQMQTADEAYYAAWPSIDASNRKLVRAVESQVDFSCATIGSSGGVRGYLNLLFDRAIVESTTMADLQNFHARNRCGYVYIEAGVPFVDLPSISSIRIIDRAGDRTLTSIAG